MTVLITFELGKEAAVVTGPMAVRLAIPALQILHDSAGKPSRDRAAAAAEPSPICSRPLTDFQNRNRFC